MKSNLTVVGLAAGVLVLSAPLAGLAVCPASAFNPNLVPDGTPVMETILGDGVGRTYIAQLTAGRSYSLQVISPTQNGAQMPYSLDPVGSLLGGVATTTDTTTIDPRIEEIEFMGAHNHGGRRISILVSSSGHFIFTFCNPDNLTHPLVVTLVETTLYNPLWSTFGGFETFYRFQNTTNAACTVTLRMVNDAGMQVANTTFPMPANSTVPTVFTGPTAQGGLNLPNDQAGQAIITHDCPPGAIQADGFLGRFDLAAPVVLPIKIVAARETR